MLSSLQWNAYFLLHILILICLLGKLLLLELLENKGHIQVVMLNNQTTKRKQGKCQKQSCRF